MADLMCEDCGRVGPDVDETLEPEWLELCGEEVPMALCDGCYFDRAQNV